MDESVIYNETTSITYHRGHDLFLNGSVIQMKTSSTGFGNYEHIDAVVRSSYAGTYDVEITVDMTIDEILDYYCECPAYAKYNGMCKHCVAVSLAYISKVEHQNVPTVPNSPSLADSTSMSLRELLVSQQMQAAEGVLQEEKIGTIQLEPHLSLQDGRLTLDLKIGVSKKYVIKDIFTFDKAMSEGSIHSYGKNLSFLHTEKMFDVSSIPLLHFLRNWVSQNGSRYIQYTHYNRFYSQQYMPKLRHLPLNGGEIDAFFLLPHQDSYLVKIGNPDERMLNISDSPHQEKIHIVGKQQGLNIRLSKTPYCKGLQYDYYFFEDSIHKTPKLTDNTALSFLQSMDKLNQQSGFISNEDIPAFSQTLLPQLEGHFIISRTNFDESEYGVSSVAFEVFLDMPQDNFIVIKAEAIYADTRYPLLNPKQDTAKRNLRKESDFSKLVSAYTNSFNPITYELVLADDEDLLFDLISEGIPRFQAVSEVFISDALKKLTIKRSPKVTLGISLAGNLLELTVDADDISKDLLIEILSKYKQRKKYYRLKDGSFMEIGNDSLEAFHDLKENMHLTDKELQKDVITVPGYRALYLDEEAKNNKQLSIKRDVPFKSLIRNMKTVEDNDFTIPSSLQSVLREYQEQGLYWLKALHTNGFAGILADDMGLGKTLQVIAFLLSEYEENPENLAPILVICPASLVFNWKNELERFAPSLRPKMMLGSMTNRRNILNNFESGDIFITSYDLLRRDVTLYENLSFGIQIIDEAQFIKNASTKISKAVKSVPSTFRIALTGTPVENRLSELWSIFDYLMPGFLYSYKSFRDEIEIPIVQNNDEKAAQRLRRMIRPFVLRRIKKDVLTDLPDKLEKTYYADMSGEQKKLYQAHVKRLQLFLDKQSEDGFKHSKIQVLSELTKLRQLCCDPGLLYEDYNEESSKLQMCIDLISKAVNGGHKILLFSQFTSMLELITAQLDHNDISYYKLTGATSKERRNEMVTTFNQDNTQVFCISLKAGGTGLNLTASDIVIHYDPWWNQAVQNQATDRAHRIGQQQIVTVYKLVVKETIEENILKLQQMKQALADEILSGEGFSSANFTKDELLALL